MSAPTGYSASDYPPFAVTVDLVVFTVRDGQLCLLLVERGGDPYKGFQALPGGFVNEDESLPDAAARELEEETGVPDFKGHLEQLGTFGAPGRDPRMRVVSVAYVAFAPDMPEPVAGSDAAAARWFPVGDVLGDENTEADQGFEPADLAFDHEVIIRVGLERVRSKLEYTTLATQFVAEPFTLSELYDVYRTVWNQNLDLKNFRRKVLSTPGFVVQSVGKRQPPGGGAPANVYVAGDGAVLQPAMLRRDEDA